MSEVLVPYPQFDASDLARQLSSAVEVSKDLLETRNLLGPIARYGASLEYATEKVIKGQADTNPDHFAVVNAAGNVVGGASIYHGLELRKLRVALPPRLARGPLAARYPYANPNIAAWTRPGEEEILEGAYRQLTDLAYKPRIAKEPHETPWAVESVNSPKSIHEAIMTAGLTRLLVRRYDEGESNRDIPPRSALYVKSESEWVTAHGYMRELKTGKWKRLDPGPDDPKLGGH